MVPKMFEPLKFYCIRFQKFQNLKVFSKFLFSEALFVFQLMMEIIQVWGDKSSLNHISYEQHFYLTQALIICMAFITDKQKEENKDGRFCTVFVWL